MTGIQVTKRFCGRAAAASARPAPRTRRGRVGRLVIGAINVMLATATALVVFVVAGLVGNPWYRLVTIEGGSMEPAISRGDVILVAPAPARVEPGMVIVMRVGDEVVTHRILAVAADGTFVTRGDANGADDDWEGQQVTVEGQYLATVPLLGRFLPASSASHASFRDAVTAGMQITVGSFPPPVTPPTPAECTGMTFSEVIVGTEGDDTIHAGNGGALVFGLGGNDTISGGNGKDCLVGGPGDDTLVGGNGKDVLLGGDGNDTLHGDGDEDVIEGGNGKDLIDGGDGIDACYGTRKDVFVSCETESTNGSPAPVGAPEATPMDATSPTPDASQAAGPTPDPNGTPAPTPTAAPDPTPAPDTTPDTTPDPTATPAPDPTPSGPPPHRTPRPPEPTPAPTPAP